MFTLQALQLFLNDDSHYIKRATQRVKTALTLSLIDKSPPEVFDALVECLKNDLDLIDITTLFISTPHKEVAEYLISGFRDSISPDLDLSEHPWKIILLEGKIETLKPTGRGDTIWCDGSCNPETMPDGWGSVVDSKGKDLLDLPENSSICSGMKTKIVTLPRVGVRRIIYDRFDDVKQQQHNGLELMALVVCLRLAAVDSSIKFINSDSQVAISWSTGVLNSGSKAKMDKRKYAYVLEAAKLRKEFELRGGKIVKVSGDSQLADLGWH